ncbi:maleylpyruvate isomerase family mycothiol-dependent enzyme [Streptomyces durbertensis]|uniref:Maleylpyruvate isomerase family mycothiol-dependent enzyme n=1 Tax=Streptomyces durbertensis TaxID=2448886 RepID=A0ABR6EGK5_9ACTN|nr:maleylpyruvate isomerase family mycothiol-dependent enzyme [Streptomyces durbertensis]MBB1244461.1 maleylpyruvate isomerase family mycothiol-dependent enzyme [Streptomyces durbertensis]
MRREELCEAVEESTRRLLTTVDRFTDNDLPHPSLVPPWTRGHVLSHLARAADSLRRLLHWARTGEPTPQYASMAARAAEIEAGAGRSAPALAADIRATAEHLRADVRALPPAGWRTPVRPRTGEWCTAERLVGIRLRELEVHHVDLDAGYTFADVPGAATDWILHDILTTLAARDDTPALRITAADAALDARLGRDARPGMEGAELSGTRAALLGWLTGRTAGEGVTVAGAGRVPRAPYWI